MTPSAVILLGVLILVGSFALARGRGPWIGAAISLGAPLGLILALAGAVSLGVPGFFKGEPAPVVPKASEAATAPPAAGDVRQ